MVRASKSLIVLTTLLLLSACRRQTQPTAQHETKIVRLNETLRPRSLPARAVTSRSISHATSDTPTIATSPRKPARVTGRNSDTDVVFGRVTLPDGSRAEGAQVTVVLLPQSRTSGVRLRAGTRTPAELISAIVNIGEIELTTASTTTDASGDYKFALRNSVPVLAVARRRGSGGGTASITDADQLRTLPVQLDVELTTPTQLQGSVTDDAGKPIAGALLSAVEKQPVLTPLMAIFGSNEIAQKLQAHSSPDGRFQFEDAAPGEYSLLASATGLVASRQDVRTPDADIHVKLSREGASLEGHVFDFATRNAIPGARVIIAEHSADPAAALQPLTALAVTSGDDGGFRFTQLSPGTFRITGEKGKLRTAANASNATNIQVPAGGTVTDVNVFLHEGYRIAGKVLNSTTRKPVSDVEVWMDNDTEARAATNSSGEFIIEGVHPDAEAGWLLIHARHPNYILADAPQDGPNVTMIKINPENHESKATITMTRLLDIHGFVLTEDAQPIPGAEIVGGNLATLASTGFDGGYSVRLPMEKYATVCARAQGYVQNCSPTNLDDQTTEVTIVLGKGGRVAGIVVDENGSPAEGVQVMFGSGARMNYNAKTDESGQFSIEGAPLSQTIDLDFQKIGYQWRRLHVEPNSGERENLRVQLTKAHIVAGTVMNEDGEPLEATVVSVSGKDNFRQNLETNTGKGGKFNLMVANDPPSLTITSQGYERLFEPSVALDRNDYIFVLKHAGPPRQITCVVEDADTKQPISDFRVTANGVKVDQQPGLVTLTDQRPTHNYSISVFATGYDVCSHGFHQFPNEGDPPITFDLKRINLSSNPTPTPIATPAP